MLRPIFKIASILCLVYCFSLNVFSQEIKSISDHPVYISHDGHIISPDSIPEKYKTKQEFPDSWIIQFKGEPLSKKANSLKSAAIQDYQSVFNAFESDLRNIDSSGLILKSGKTTQLKRKFTKTFFGASIDNVSSSSLDQIKKLSYVKTAYRNEIVKGHLAESAAIINAPTARANHGVTGAGVKVGILDSGIDYTHTALGGGFGAGFKVAGGYDFVNNDNDPMDDNFHGTHVAGIVASADETYTGVAPEVELYALKCLNYDGEGHNDDVILAKH